MTLQTLIKPSRLHVRTKTTTREKKRELVHLDHLNMYVKGSFGR